MGTPRLPLVDCTDAPADLNGLVRFAERRNLVSARVPSHCKRSLQHKKLPPTDTTTPIKKQEPYANGRHCAHKVVDADSTKYGTPLANTKVTHNYVYRQR